MCDYATVEKNALNKHIRFKHTHDRPFLCNICGFSTHTQSVMARVSPTYSFFSNPIGILIKNNFKLQHKRGHDKSKPHVCNTCGSAYAVSQLFAYNFQIVNLCLYKYICLQIGPQKA